MISPVNAPNCFSAFNSSKKIIKKQEEAPLKVKLASVAGAGVCALGAAYFIAKRQGKALNQAINMFNVKYNEPELMGVAVSSVLGGLIAGGLTDKKEHFSMKVKEGVHQIVANIAAPLLLIGGLNKLYEKYPIKNLPQFAADTKLKRFANEAIKMAPHLVIATAGLIGGVYLGTAVANRLNGLSDTEKERNVKAVDFIYHPDDVAAAFAIADKNGVLKKFVSKIIPPIFMFHGYDTGTRR